MCLLIKIRRRRHYETKLKDKYKDLETIQRSQNVDEMKKTFRFPTECVKKTKSQNEAAVKASYIVAEEIANSTRASFLKSTCLKFFDQVCFEKKQSFSNVSLEIK